MAKETFNFQKRRDCRIFAMQQLSAYLILKEKPQFFLKNLFENSEFYFTGSYAEVLLENTINHQTLLVNTIEKHLKEDWSFTRLFTQDKAVLLIASYEIIKGGIAKKVAINEAMEIAKIYSSKKSAIYINAVLDKM